MYVSAPAGEETEWHTLDGMPVKPIEFDSMGAVRRHIDDAAEIDNYTIYGNDGFQYAYIADNYHGQIEIDPKLIVIANVDIEVASRTGFRAALDTVNTPEEIISITLKASNEDKFHVFGTKPYIPSDEVIYYECDDEDDLLKKFLELWTKIEPDAMTGWNIIGYDIPYMVHRITKKLGAKTANKLSPFGHIRKVTHKRFDQEYISYAIAGVNILDYQQLYRKNVLEPMETYSLNFIAEVELDEHKLDYSEYRNLWEMYQKNHQKFIEYNIHDVRLVDQLEAKRRIIQLQQTVAYRSKVNMEDVMSQVRTWDAIIYNHLRDRNIVVPLREVDDKDTQYAGAFVKEPEPGLYHWVVSFDVNSLYPSLIAALNIGIETKLDREIWEGEQAAEIKRMSSRLMLERKPRWELFEGLDISMGANGATYDRSRPSVLTTLIVELLAARKEYRKIAENGEKELEAVKLKLRDDPKNPELLQQKHDLEYTVANFDLKQRMTKVLNNSLYGCLGNEFFRFYDTENAEAITVTGQFAIQYVEREINAFLNKRLGTVDFNYIIAADTDSNYINLEPMVKKYLPNETNKKKIVDFIDKVCKQILEPEINRIFAEIRDEFIHGNGNFLAMKREVIAEKGIWTKKKRYVLSIWDKEGIRYDKPKLKYTGLEMKGATIPKCSRDAMKRCCEIILHGTQEELYEFVEQYYQTFMTKDIPEIAISKGVKNLEKYTDPRTIAAAGSPQHVRGSLMYNYLLVEKGLESVYTPILEGEKIKLVHLKEYNPTHQNAIAFPAGMLPPEFGLNEYVDKESMYKKGFLEPMGRIADAAKWSLVKKANIDNLFD